MAVNAREREGDDSKDCADHGLQVSPTEMTVTTGSGEQTPAIHLYDRGHQHE
jgi:hypothetical protein